MLQAHYHHSKKLILFVLASVVSLSSLAIAEPPGPSELTGNSVTTPEFETGTHNTGGATTRLKDKPFKLSTSLFLQNDWVITRQSSEDEIDRSTGTPLNETRFLLRRGRLRIDGSRGPISGRFELDANTVNSVTLRPFEAVVSWRILSSLVPNHTIPFDATFRPALSRHVDITLNGGLMRIPFGFESSETDVNRPVLERSLVSRALMASGRDLGIGLNVVFDIVTLSIAYMNGEPLDENRFAGLDPTVSKDVVGRAFVDAPLGSRLKLQAGFSAASGTGFHAGTAAIKPTLLWTDGNENGLVEQSELSTSAGSPATPSKSYSRAAIGANIEFRYDWPVLGQTRCVGELIRAKNYDRGILPVDPISQGRDVRELGGSILLSQELTRFGQFAARYAYYDPDADSTRKGTRFILPKNSSMSLLSVALAARFSNDRLLLEYDHNRDHLARSLTGIPTRLRDDTVTLRMEVALP